MLLPDSDFTIESTALVATPVELPVDKLWTAASAAAELLRKLGIEEFALGGSFAVVAHGYTIPDYDMRGNVQDIDFAVERSPTFEELADEGLIKDESGCPSDGDDEGEEHGIAVTIHGIKVDFIPFGGSFSNSTPPPARLREILMEGVQQIRGIPVMTVAAVLEWKRLANRAKDHQFIHAFTRQLMVRTVQEAAAT